MPLEQRLSALLQLHLHFQRKFNGLGNTTARRDERNGIWCALCQEFDGISNRFVGVMWTHGPKIYIYRIGCHLATSLHQRTPLGYDNDVLPARSQVISWTICPPGPVENNSGNNLLKLQHSVSKLLFKCRLRNIHLWWTHFITPTRGAGYVSIPVNSSLSLNGFG